jgi:hypothetical protein
MKLIRLSFLLAIGLIAGISVKAAVTVQLGNGNATATSKGPWNQWQFNNKSKKVMLFTEDELAAQGIVPGVIIHAMKWYKTTNDQFINGASATAKLYMRSVGAVASYSNNHENVLDYVSNGFTHVSTVNYNVIQNIGLADWVGFTDFYYTYTGGSLEVYVDWKTTSGYSNVTTSGNFEWRYSSTNVNRYMSYHGTPYNNSEFNLGNERPNTLMVFSVSECGSAPIAGTVTSTATSPLCQGDWFELNLVGNSGSGTQTYTWQHATSPNGPWTDFSVPLELPVIGIGAPAVTTYYRAKVKCGSFVSYSDTAEVVVNPGLGGNTFTIDNAQPTGGTNFNSFHDAIVALNCGITGPVTFNVVAGSGPYNEQIVIPQIGGASPLSPIIINGNGAHIHHTSVNPAERATIKLDGADYVTINDLEIEVSGAAGNEYGYGVHIIHNADFNTIKNCHIIVNATTASNNSDRYAGIVINGHAQDPLGINYADCDVNIIDDNTITGGYYGIILSGNSESSTITGNVLTGNTINDFYRYGIYASNNSIAIIEGNNISRPDRGNVGDFTGIQLIDYNASTLVLANRIHDPFNDDMDTEKTATGISVTNCNPGEGSEDIVANNVVYNFKTYGTQRAIAADGAGYVKFMHNTLAMEHAHPVCDDCVVYGFYQDGAAIHNLDFSNNMMSFNGEEGAAVRAMHFTNGINGTTFNNNNYYIGPDVDGEVGSINGQAYESMILWKIGVLGDLLSISTKPKYQDPTSGNFRPTNQSMADSGFPVIIVLTDIEGDIRNITTPDIGAYEFDENTVSTNNTKQVAGAMNIYPNPADGIVNVGGKDKVNISVTGMDGRLLLHSENTNAIDMSALTEGLYIIKVSNNEGEVLKTEKILKSSK